ncbi:MAG: hypothetical protein J6T16_02815, partial [Opitutales bacterium]|nr:hypothetical protein [Opitutales bacterium]
MKKLAAIFFRFAPIAIIFAGALLPASAGAASAPLARDFRLKDCEGGSMAIVVPKNAAERENEAAQILKKYLKKALPQTEIFISSNPKDAFKYKSVSIKKSPEAKEISRGGDFSRAISSTISAAGTRAKIEYCADPITAVGCFLRELGFDFYAPGELGAEIADLRGAKIEGGKKTFTPLFVSSNIYAPPIHKTREYLLLGGQQNLVQNFSHNFKNIFDFEFAPEYLPTLKKYASKKFLQPKFNLPG